MPRQIKAYVNDNRPIVGLEDATLRRTYFNLVKLNQDETFSDALSGYEAVCVVLSGAVNLTVAEESFFNVGQRTSVWDGNADSVYVPSGAEFSITAASGSAEIAVAGGLCETQYPAFRISPEDVSPVDVGSNDTHSRRIIRHILGADAEGRSGNLLVSELYCDDGCWSGYPPHKHDTADENETAHEEVYHYRFQPDTGFGAQFCYDDDGQCEVYKTEQGDTVLIEGGYHPTVTSPGHREYIFTILVGRDQKSLVQRFHADQQHLMSSIPGIDAMREKFKE